MKFNYICINNAILIIYLALFIVFTYCNEHRKSLPHHTTELHQFSVRELNTEQQSSSTDALIPFSNYTKNTNHFQWHNHTIMRKLNQKKFHSNKNHNFRMKSMKIKSAPKRIGLKNVKILNENGNIDDENVRRHRLKNHHTHQQHQLRNHNHQKRKRGSRGQRQKLNKNELRLLASSPDNIENIGAFPALFNIAPRALITVNATCGKNGREEYCKLVDAYPHKAWATQCGICNEQSSDYTKHHSIEKILDNINLMDNWWQSPTLRQGRIYEYITITLDLRQAFQIFFIMLKAAISPRPASWVLEKSMDNITFEPWQYFGLSDADCRRRYNTPGQNGKYIFGSDNEVVCTTQFSKAMPLENGEIHVSLLKNRPGAIEQSPELLRFITARYIRIRFEGMHSTANIDNSVDWLLDAQSLEKRSFYSLKQIRISGRLNCHGHANRTIEVVHQNGDDDDEDEDDEELLECSCIHNTCGPNCNVCCEQYDEKRYADGTLRNPNVCAKCECNGNADWCKFDELLGGSVCQNCTNNSDGVKCELCLAGYYRNGTNCEKCDCNVLGGLGNNCDAASGVCECREGFIGDRCEFCASGYYGESCLQCACDSRGSVTGGKCAAELCECKSYVEGETCSQCLPGYFGLRSDNVDGCQKCYCSGVGAICKSAQIQTMSYETLDGWQVTDLARTVFAYPSLDNDTGNLVFGMYDLPGIESFYWLAPKGYLGNKLSSYGAKIVVQLSWVVIRGDTSGKPTVGPNIILVGRNGMRIAFGDNEFASSSALIAVDLTERGWYYVPDNVRDIVTRMRRNEYHGDALTRLHFMSIISDLEAVLIRGRFHTDQVESILERSIMYAGGDDASYGTTEQGLIEECLCPAGYTGLSCESCDFGYIRITENSTAHEIIGKCIPCPCNGHTDSCDLELGKCGECQHNTYGERCERCKVGFYGNPMQGTANDCKRCACPLTADSNNFSPNCQLKKLSLDINQYGVFEEENFDYICTQCPIGSTGDHCEMCDDGFYGNPTELGSKCQPCNCNGGPCDIFTGECIDCLGNTEGWRCERCKIGYWGDPAQGCSACNCYNQGSSTDVCDAETGQCLCQAQFTGFKCDKCDDGYADIDLKCPPCQCNPNGSIDNNCDPISGQCKCRDGVDGLKCELCKEEYFGLTDGGCEGCLCSSGGSASKICDRRTGQCLCHTNVTGRRCEKCFLGNWNLTVGIGCVDCRCDRMGSLNDECDTVTGQCNCKNGVGGQRCDQCLDNYYGFSNYGCQRCDLCQSVGHICDPDTGRCICPPNSKGPDCVHCHPGTWGWKLRSGCDRCDCDIAGSIGQACDVLHGQCICREGYTGRRCDACSIGYFGYPDCRRCNCNIDGSFIRGDGLIECDSNGQCPCKELVIGLKCDTCVHSTFGLARHNPEGCTKCFCFGRSQDCQQSDLSWGHVRMPSSRNLSVQYIHPTSVPNKEYDYIVVVQMEGTEIYHQDAEMGQMNGLNLIPSSNGNVSIGAYTQFYYPLYFQLPPQFCGDKTNSYGGYLRFNVNTEGSSHQMDKKILYNFPLVQIHSHNKLVLDYYDTEISDVQLNESYSVPLHESYWKFHHNRQDVGRAVIMAALQNIKHIFLRGTSWADFEQVVLHQVLMDSAIFLSGSTNIIAHGVEKCLCSSRYDGLSCQDPGHGYYRWKNTTDIVETVFLDDLIGRSVRCDCNGRSENCNPETGMCLECGDNSGGYNCERCAEGYYGDPNFGGCQSCPCPETSRNFARGCTVWLGEVSCICKTGYTGALCDRCRNGFFGFPQSVNGSCESCQCNEDGIVSDECDEETGQCNCRTGVTGRQCNICLEERHTLEDRRCKLCDNCTLILMDYVDTIGHKLRRGIVHMDLSGVPAPWLKLDDYDTVSEKHADRLQNLINTENAIENYDGRALEKLVSYSENAMVRWGKLNTTATKRNIGADILRTESNLLYLVIGSIRDSIQKTIFDLNNYGNHDHHISLPIALDQAQLYFDEIKIHEDTRKGMRNSWKCAFEDLNYYGRTSDMVFDQKAELEKFWRQFNKTNRRFSDIGHFTDITIEKLIEAGDIQDHIVNTQSYLLDSNKQSKDMKEEILQYLDNNFMGTTGVYLDMIEGNNRQISVNTANLKGLHEFWNESFEEGNHLRRDLRKHWLPKINRHSNRLMERSNEYVKQFQITKDGAKVALLASSAHKNILDAIDAAREASIESQERVFAAQEKLYPKNGSSVVDLAEILLKKSKNLKQHGIHEMDKIHKLNTDLKIHEDAVDSIKSIIWKAGIKSNNISVLLQNIRTGNQMAQSCYDLAAKISAEMRAESKKAVDTRSQLYKLRQKFAGLEPDWETKKGLADENIAQTKGNIRSANILLSNAEVVQKKAQQKFQMWNETVADQLQHLKDKIAKAKHAAEGIKVSLESLTPKCIRSYLTHSSGLSTSNSIKLTMVLRSNNGSSPLIFIQGMDRKFIALELYRRQIRFIWNFGGETVILKHELEIQTLDPKSDDTWYRIEANRTLNVGSLLVRRMKNSPDLNAEKNSNSNSIINVYSDLKYTRFFRAKTDRIWLGGIPHDLRTKDLLAPSGLNVVVHQLHVDNEAVGLWNFAHSEGKCGGAVLGVQESSNTWHFNGQGYSVVKQARSRAFLRKNVFVLHMTFKTFDDNALLFLAVDQTNNYTISVTLLDGHIVFRMDYNDFFELVLTSVNKYNIGKWVTFEAAREFSKATETGKLTINNKNPIKKSTKTSIKENMLPDLSKDGFILGGIPPGFPRDLIKNKYTENSFLGCVRDVNINQEIYDPLESSSYFGVEQSCMDIVTKAGFIGTGYIELPSHTLRKRANFAFAFRTMQPDCLLLLSAYPPGFIQTKPNGGKEMRGNYSVSLIDGRIHVWVNSGRSSVKLTSNQSVNDGEYHVVNVIKMIRQFELIVDDERHDTKSLSNSPNLINMPLMHGGLYFGGSPEFPDYKGLVPTFIGLQGAIRDIVFNNKSVAFSEALKFENVEIGRSGPQMGMGDVLMKTEPVGKQFKTVPEGCQNAEGYSYEPNAYKYGDNQWSFSQLNIPIRHFWQKNFHIRFDLRTFYPSGILVIAPGTKDKQKHYVALMLKDGHLILIVRGRRKEELTLTAKLNNGEWHHVTIHCQDRKVTMSVEIGGTDQKTSAQMKVPKKISASNSMYVGGLPENSVHLPSELMLKLEGFKGCIRGLEINNNTQDLARDKKHLNVGQCFPRVEKGSYFPGDAYAIYRKNFHVGHYLELEMHFRTSEMNGVLLSVSEPVGFPALSLELHDGNVVLSCDLGDGNPFRVEPVLPSKFTICDNKWHNISALYDVEQIALRLDNYAPTISLAQHRVSGKVQTKSPLYIGGLPDTAPSGTLQSRTNFKGCIRNISIRNERRDWVDMDGLYNVLLSECLAL